MKILVLKAPKETLDDVDPYVVALQEFGLVAVSVDVLSFQYVNKDILLEKITHPERYGGLVFTSPRGVVAVEQCLDDNVFDKASWASLPCYVVGEGTAKVVKEKFGMISIGQECGNARQLAQEISKDRKGQNFKPLLFPSADLKRNLLVETLNESVVLIDVVVAYKTVPHPNVGSHLERLLTDMQPDVLVFFSPSGVNTVVPHLTSLGDSPLNYKVVAIGPTTQAALQEHGLTVSATASNPSPSGLVEAIQLITAH